MMSEDGRKNIRVLFFVVGVLVIALAGFFWFELSRPGRVGNGTAAVIRIGVTGPLDSRNGALGTTVLNVANMAIKDFPVPGKQVDVILQGHACAKDTLRPALDYEINDAHVSAILETSCSNASYDSADIPTAAHIPFLVGNSLYGLLHDYSPYVFTMYPTDWDIGAALGNEFRARGYRRALVLTPASTAPGGFLGGLDSTFVSGDPSYSIARADFSYGNVDANALTAAIKNADFDVIIPSAGYPDAFSIVKAIRASGTLKPIFVRPDLLTRDGATLFGGLDNDPRMVEGIYGFSPSRPWTPKFSDFLKRYQDTYHKLPGDADNAEIFGFNPFVSYQLYDMLGTILSLYQKAPNVTPDDLAKALRSGNTIYEGTTGPVGFTGHGGRISYRFTLSQYKGGKLSAIEAKDYTALP